MAKQTKFKFQIEFIHVQFEPIAKQFIPTDSAARYDFRMLPLDDWGALVERVSWAVRYSARHNWIVPQIYSISALESIPHSAGQILSGTPVWVNWSKLPTTTPLQRRAAIWLIKDFRPLWKYSLAGRQAVVQAIQPIAPWEVRQYGLH